MGLKITGKEKDVKKFIEILKERQKQRSGKSIDGKESDGDFRIIMGSIEQCSYEPDFKTSTKGKVDPDAKLYIRGIANARIVDRLDEVVEPAGGNFKNFMANPMLLADHRYQCDSAIGQVIGIMPEYDGVHFEAWIGDPQAAMLTEKQKLVRSLVAQGIVKTVSIGFIPNEIKAPVWDDQGNMQSPAIVNKWEMLELSLIPIPCNAGSLFDMKLLEQLSLNTNDPSSGKSLSETIKEIENECKASSTTVQSLIFDKKKFTIEQAKKWAADHDFRNDKVDETAESIRLRQRDPNDFIENSFRTIELTDGVKAVIGRLKDNLDMEKKIDEIIENQKTLTMYVEGIKLDINKHIELSNQILGEINEKKKPCKKPDDEKPCDEKPDEEMKSLNDKVNSLTGEITEIKNVLKAIIEKL